MGFLTFLFGNNNHDELKNALQKNAFLVDVRSPSEFSSGSVKGAVNIPLNQVSSQLSKFKGKEHIVVFCKSGIRSGQAKSILKKNGFENVINGKTWKKVKKITDGS